MAFLLSILINLSFAQPLCEVPPKKNANLVHIGQVGKYMDEVWFWQFGGEARLEKRDMILQDFHIDGRLNQYEVKVLKNRDVRIFPEDMLAIKNATCDAYALSMAICGRTTKAKMVDADDEETDALRHLLLSSLLSHARGRKFTQEFLTAHEIPPQGPNGETSHPEWKENDPLWQQPKYERMAMDLHNNKVGRSFGLGIGNTEKPAKSFAKKAIKELSRDPRRIRVNRTGTSRCNDQKELKKLNWSQVFRDMELVKKTTDIVSCKPLGNFLK